MKARSRSHNQVGNVTIEFVLVAALLFVPLVLGLASIGIALVRSLQVAQLTRDVGRMFVRGVDFSQQLNQDLITGSEARPNLPALAAGLGMEGNGGNATGGTTGRGVLILSVLTRISDTCGCNNAGHTVVSRRIVVGNKNILTSEFGHPLPGLIDTATGAVTNYTNDPSARADNFSSLITLSSEELAYVVEAGFGFPDLVIPGFYTNPAVRWRSVF